MGSPRSHADLHQCPVILAAVYYYCTQLLHALLHTCTSTCCCALQSVVAHWNLDCVHVRALFCAPASRKETLWTLQDFYKAVYAMVRDDAESHGMGPRSYDRRSRDYDRHDSPPRRRHSSRERSSRDAGRHRNTPGTTHALKDQTRLDLSEIHTWLATY